METFGQGFLSFTSHHCYCSMPTSLIWCETCLGLRFWVWISIYGFGSLFVFGFVCQMSRKHLTKTHELRHHHWQCHHQWPSIFLFLCSNFFFPSFGLVLYWFGSWSICRLDLVIFDLGLKGGLGMVVSRFVGIFDLGFFSKWL